MKSINPSVLLGVCAYFAALVFLVSRRSAYLPGRAVYLLRALFPSWRFFEDLAALPRLYYRVAVEDGDFGEWHSAAQHPRRSLSSLFFNPAGNLELAYLSLLQQAEHDMQLVAPGAEEEFVHSVSYRLLERLVRERIKNRFTGAAIRRFQFKLRSTPQNAAQGEAQDVLISPEHSY